MRILSRLHTTALTAMLFLGLVGLSTLGCHGDNAAPAPAPAVSASSPIEGAVDVPLNGSLTANFNTPMAPLTASDFTLARGSTNVPGVVTTSANGLSATFTPNAPLEASSVHTATIAAGALTLTGLPLQDSRTWSFTTGTEADTTPPTVTSNSPLTFATDVPLNSKVSATFSEAMTSSTITTSSFTVMRGTAFVTGTVSYGPGTTATFTPTALMTASSVHTAIVSIDVQDLQGNAMTANHVWTFTTGSVTAQGPATVGLGAAGNYAILAKSGVSTVPTSAVTGDIGLSPAAASFLTGFSPVADSTNVFSTSSQVTGQLFASNYAVPTPSNLTTAVSNMEGAYTDAASRPDPDHLELGGGSIGGMTLAPGLYKWTSTLSIPTSVTLNGGAADVWIFQTTGNLTQASGTTVTLSGGALAKNIFWQVAGVVTIGGTAHFEGIILCQTEVTLVTGATLNGRILAQTQVALQQATVTEPSE
jgi:hypothetical protein